MNRMRDWHVRFDDFSSVAHGTGPDAVAIGLGVEIDRHLGGMRLRGFLGAGYRSVGGGRGGVVRISADQVEFGEGFPMTLPGARTTYFTGLPLDFRDAVVEGATEQLRAFDLRGGELDIVAAGYDMESAELVFRSAAGLLVCQLAAKLGGGPLEELVNRYLDTLGSR
ncbi:hypothetical protein [Streptacidiphilus melanogenes]|uniref:hypothetical protein n=1 Tax=Streptacidiphilus melanogenes TaxID=411235 RepID=UPI001269C817|nr:hypothetical protein [Streptacidiphilus melanogenes]